MNLVGSVAFVTGANRGLGREIVRALCAAGAGKVYASARQLSAAQTIAALDPGRIVPIQLDVREADRIGALASECPDVNVLVNNAGINRYSPLIGAPDTQAARDEFETNVFGPINTCRAFAPVLARNGGGAIVNISSILGRVAMPGMGSLCASKAALLSLTQGIRGELAKQGTLVVGVFPGPMDTDMAAGYNGPKLSPADAARAIVDGLTNGTEDVYPDDFSKGVSAGLAADPKSVERQFASFG